MWKKPWAVAVALGLTLGWSASPAWAQDLPTQTSTLFSGSGNCAFCHTPGNGALVDPNGNDISPTTLWRSSMMANSAKDPLFQAKVTAEVAEHPQYQTLIEDKCTTCHSPLGRTEAIYNGAPYYTLEEMQNDPLALDGVSCTSCHQIKEDNLGTGESFSGNYIIENDRLIYGPHPDPLEPPMQNFVNYTPVYSLHIETSELCATCHTLFTPTLDDSGQIVGEIPEQTPYLEWRNSVYPAQGVECQTCHMPATDFATRISNRPAMIQPRMPLHLHEFVGGNVFMLRILRDHGDEIGVTATPEQFDSTIMRTLRMLQEETAELTAAYTWRPGDTLEVTVRVQNLTGHKFPTGYPSRRAWLYLAVTSESGDTLFVSGAFDPATGEIIGLDEPYEPHYDRITEADQVQVYQSIMQDVNGEVTYVLLRGASYIKDNRIPPQGFTSQGPHYDSTAIAGLAAQDPNFNRENGVEGTGADWVIYRIGGLDPNQSYEVTVKLLYQSVAPRFAQHLITQYNTPEVQAFAGYYSDADKRPVTVDSLSLAVQPVGVGESRGVFRDQAFSVRVFPRLASGIFPIEVRLPSAGVLTLSLYTPTGAKVWTSGPVALPEGRHVLKWGGMQASGVPVPTGLYFLKASFRDSRTNQLQVARQKVLVIR